MLLTRLLLKRLTAVLLPVSFLWAFAACVSICGREGAEDHDRTPLSPSTEMTVLKAAPDCADCPVPSFMKATGPERAAFKLDLQVPSVAPPLMASVDDLTGGTAFDLHLQPSFADPPLTRLPILRI